MTIVLDSFMVLWAWIEQGYRLTSYNPSQNLESIYKAFIFLKFIQLFAFKLLTFYALYTL